LEPIGQAAPRPFGITLPGRRRKEGAPTLRTLALASVTAGAITTMGVGAYLLGGANHDGNKASPEVALVDPPTAAPPIIPTAAAQASPSLAVALTSSPAVKPESQNPESQSPVAKAKADVAKSTVQATAEPPSASPKASAQALYVSAVGRLDNGDLTALNDLRSAADQGSPQAQFYLARLYEAGAAGLKKDLAEARRWTARAAEMGDPSAMYNLASYMYAGDGGIKDAAGAAQWFRRAAEHGVVNGQYNLAQLYEKGYGVPLNNTEAYKWYLVAAGAGDTEAKAAADSLKGKMTPDAQAAAEHAAAQLHAQLAGGSVKTAAATP
jgi:localization factor PodJL